MAIHLGFTSVYVMAHEIGHNLGMTHDHTAGCDKVSTHLMPREKPPLS